MILLAGAPKKYLGLYFTSGANFKIDQNTAKWKYSGCFNNTKSVIGQQVNEMMVLKPVKTYCLPRLLYGRKSLPIETVDKHDLDVI